MTRSLAEAVKKRQSLKQNLTDYKESKLQIATKDSTSIMEDSEVFDTKMKPINNFEPFIPTSTRYTSNENYKKRKQRIGSRAG